MDNQQNTNVVVDNNLGMKWYKFLIYFSLFAGAVINVISGIPFLTGSIYDTSSGYEGTSDLVYAFYPGLKTIDVMYGIVALATAVLCIVARFALAKYKKSGPALLLSVYAVGIVISIIYFIAFKAIVTDVDLDTSSIVSSMVSSVVMIIINKIYFDKRKHLFVN